jgi:hypothetical protein
MLYLDDSGKPDANHPSGAVVIGGFAVDADAYPIVSSRILGAKGRFFPGRGVPQAWEVKSTALVKPNPWKRAKNRDFCHEVARIVEAAGGTVYTATLVKARMKHPMTLATTMPLQLQALVEHFDVECRARGVVGIVVADWSSHQHDQHASQCVASFVASRGLSLHPCVYYASSHSCEGIQVADLVSAVRRRAAEGDGELVPYDRKLASIRPTGLECTVHGRSYTNSINVL